MICVKRQLHRCSLLCTRHEAAVHKNPSICLDLNLMKDSRYTFGAPTHAWGDMIHVHDIYTGTRRASIMHRVLPAPQTNTCTHGHDGTRLMNLYIGHVSTMVPFGYGEYPRFSTRYHAKTYQHSLDIRPVESVSITGRDGIIVKPLPVVLRVSYHTGITNTVYHIT